MRAPGFEGVHMAGGEDWLLRPWMAGKCDYKDLKTPGVLDLVDIAIMNEALDVQQENEARGHDHAAKK